MAPPEWTKHRSKLLKAYFNENGIFPDKSATFDEFLTFLKGIERKTDEKFFVSLGSNHGEKHNSTGVVTGPYDKGLDSRFKMMETVTDRFLIRHIPQSAILQFEYIVELFLEYINWKKMKKITQMRQTQATLPIAQSRKELIDMLDQNNVVVLAGDTGCGKSTQVPQYLLQAGYKKIACTQPRRIACTALAKRVAYETLNVFGSEVAFQTRFEKNKTSRTRLLFLTDGLLVRQMLMDPLLQQYDVIVLDEVHERHLGGDLLVSLMKMLLQRRDDLKLILMSATINLQLFSDYFEGAPVLQVPGRLFPIEVQYMPVKEYDVDEKKKSARIDSGPYLKILQMIDKKHSNKERGDMLIFLNGLAEIQMLADALKEYAEYSKRWIILMLHSTLSVEEQNKVFDVAPPGVRKCILSTNIAETSVTIDEIRFVVDSGKVNLLRYDPATRSHRLVECWISRASSEQRKGRAGRTGPGTCFRLYSRDQVEKMDAFTPSEIRRVALESLIMQILNMGLGLDVRDFPFLEPPDKDALNHALDVMKCQSVVETGDSKQLTPLGLILATLPVDLLMLIYGILFNEVDVALTVAAGLSVQSPFTNRSFRDYDTVQNRQSLMSDLGDPFTLIKVYREWLDIRRRREDTKKWSRKCGIEEGRLYEIVKLRRQFKQILEQSDLLSSRMDKEWTDLSSRERKIKLGEKRKLNELKRRAQHETRKRKTLKEGQHFDTILDQQNEEGEPQDDINSLEFQVLVDHAEVAEQLRSHKLDHDRSLLLQLVLALGLYPQLAVEDPHNNHHTGSEQFTHTATKPFTILHPNSALGQAPECLNVDKDKDGFSSGLQLVFFGLLLETVKPFLCNTARIPALFLPIFARNVSFTSMESLSCDGFVELIFRSNQSACQVLDKALEIRQLITDMLQSKLAGADIADLTSLLRTKVTAYFKACVPFFIKRFVHPPRAIESGVFGLNNQPYREVVVDKESEEPEVDQLETEPDVPAPKKGAKAYFCEQCDRELWFDNNIQILQHRRSHQV